MKRSCPAVFAIVCAAVAEVACAAHLPAVTTDQMKEQVLDVAGAKARFVLHPNTSEFPALLRNVSPRDVPKPGDIFSFAAADYVYREKSGLTPDGRVTVKGILSRRGAALEKMGVTFLDVDRMISVLAAADPKQNYEKVLRDGRTWIKRSKGAGPGRDPRNSIRLEWMAPLTADLEVLFLVELEDYQPRKGNDPAAWRSSAEALQTRIFESFHLE